MRNIVTTSMPWLHTIIFSRQVGIRKKTSKFKLKANAGARLRETEIAKSVAKCVHFCGKQCIALRGHRGDNTVNQNGNRGNFLARTVVFGFTVCRQRVHDPRRVCRLSMHRSNNWSSNFFLDLGEVGPVGSGHFKLPRPRLRWCFEYVCTSAASARLNSTEKPHGPVCAPQFPCTESRYSKSM